MGETGNRSIFWPAKWCLLFSLIRGVSFLAVAEEPELWSLQSVNVSAVPEIPGEWPLSEIDHFIASKWRDKGVEPVGDASPEILVRRLYFNLTGLPPTLKQISDFSETGLEGTLDQLLASPRFGEKWARHWLDLARYAESNGADRNVVFAHAWRYRNWVIDAFNSDLPYNQFIQEQIAGDLLPGAGDSQLVATGFLTLGPKSFQETNREKFLMDMVDEQIDVMSRSILGLTIACSRCHDHKFDPIPQADYYALAGILLSSKTLHGPGPLYFQNHQHNQPVLAIGSEKEKLDPGVQKWRGEIYGKTVKAMTLRSAAYKIKRTVTGSLREGGLKKPEEDPALLKMHNESEAMYAEAKELLDQRETMMKEVPAKPGYAMVMQESGKPEDCHLRERGVHNEHGEKVPRGRLTIPGMPSLDEIGGGSGRRELADWLVSEKNPLTARVMVNRIWYHLFGSGLVRTVDNFGVTGDEPTHPELLDYLAEKFVEDDQWSVKKLIRRIVLSRTWQLAGSGESKVGQELDPGNTLYWRANLRRLDVEAFHDAVLAVSGKLDLNPPLKGSLLADTFLGNEYGKPSVDRVNVRAEMKSFAHRAVYLPVVRNEIPDLYKQFDFPDANTTSGARGARTIPSQALFLMNDEFIEGCSKAAGEMVLTQGFMDDGSALDWAALQTEGRPFSSEIKRGLETYLKEQRSHLIGKGKSAEEAELESWTDVFQVLFSGVGFRFLE